MRYPIETDRNKSNGSSQHVLVRLTDGGILLGIAIPVLVRSGAVIANAHQQVLATAGDRLVNDGRFLGTGCRK